MPACSRYAKTTAAHGTAAGSGAGGEAPGRTSHYSREAVLGLSYHVKHLVVRVGQAAALRAAPSRAFTLSGIAVGRQKTCAPQTDSARRRNEHPVSARSSAVEPGVQDGAGAGESVNLRGSADSWVYLDPAGSCCPHPVPSEARGGQDEGRTAITRTS